MWLSFADASKPRGQQFLGVCIVEVPLLSSPQATFRGAIKKAHKLKINPGGEIQMYLMEPETKIAERFMNTLLDKQTLESENLGESTRS